LLKQLKAPEKSFLSLSERIIISVGGFGIQHGGPAELERKTKMELTQMNISIWSV
jgi:hypothetical protein